MSPEELTNSLPSILLIVSPSVSAFAFVRVLASVSFRFSTLHSQASRQLSRPPLLFCVAACLSTNVYAPISPLRRQVSGLCSRVSYCVDLSPVSTSSYTSVQKGGYFTMGKIVIEGQTMNVQYSSPRCYWSIGDLT